MENSGFNSNSLPPSTLVVFSQAGSLSDALRMHRPFSSAFTSRVQEAKDLVGGRGFRLIESYPGLPSHFLQQQLFGPPFPSPFPSAFAPPPLKSLKLEQILSPISVSVSPSPEESADDPTPGSEISDDGSHTLRHKKTDPSCCPVCGLSVRVGDLDSHFIQELEKLYKITSSNRSRRNKESVSDGSLENRWEAYLRIKSNRHCRLRLKTRKKKPDDVICPICNENVYGNMQQLNNHVEICLRKHGSFDVQDEEETVDVEGEGDYDDYEWSGQGRLQVSPVVLGRYGGVCERSFQNSEVDEDEGVGELVVDRDETSHYGPIQYTDADLVISLAVDNNEEKDKSLLESNAVKQTIVHLKDGNAVSKKNENSPEDEEPIKIDSVENKQIIEALKSRIRQLEAGHSSEMKFMCLICKDQYVKPLISIGCWHVYCEQCWLHTLGAKKLCPQCNMITSPSDLRRIYL
ncbi:unnamed protein product [Nezara viridula]|uniref:RING-type domain-containing protein n=1 Tax=Nezara viridula TaxID=85310 RepID=A0A9P0E6C9_NEZVI|nr:unnamed protein product [Nezara viridula]